MLAWIKMLRWLRRWLQRAARSLPNCLWASTTNSYIWLLSCLPFNKQIFINSSLKSCENGAREQKFCSFAALAMMLLMSMQIEMLECGGGKKKWVQTRNAIISRLHPLRENVWNVFQVSLVRTSGMLLSSFATPSAWQGLMIFAFAECN